MKLGTGPAKSGWHSLINSTHGRLWDRRAFSRAPQYVFQCGLATLALLIILLIDDAVLNAVVVAAVASSAFIVFVVPDSIAATPRKVIGGHLVAVLIGGALSLLLHSAFKNPVVGQNNIIFDAMAALSLGLSILLMVVTNTEHPPAAGTALALLIQGFEWNLVLFVLLSAILLSFIRMVLRNRLTNLL
ncbi:MAG: HPP family protein [Chloroflexi bacterium]|nr:HPP family protein [Chloroflexota bacterium]